ncbi:MAG TPA: BON domain-containing protein [Fimbriimonadaceae bacterium]|nr:BON domain-containing protein [Fimbriimonadaceae bacterium]
MRNIGLIVLAATVLGGCNQSDQEKITTDAKKMATDAGTALGGLTLAGKVETALRLRKDVDASTLHVEAKDGVVTITGHVKDPGERSAVYSVVSNTVGVDTVLDTDLKVDSLEKK